MDYKIILVDKKDGRVIISEEEFKKMMEEQYHEGYEKGYSIGHQAGYSKGLDINARRNWWNETDWSKITAGDSCDSGTIIYNGKAPTVKYTTGDMYTTTKKD